MMSLTCPHCETALTVPGSLPPGGVICPRCGAGIPCHDAGPADSPVVAGALDDVAWDQFADRWLGTLQPLAVLGAFGIFFYASAFLYSLVQRRLEREWIIVIGLSGATLVCGVCWLGIHVTRHARRNGTRILAWLIVGSCAFVGGGILVGLLGVIGYALVMRLW